MRARVGDTLVAQAQSDDVLRIEGNSYFPPESLVSGVLRDNTTIYICSWKGAAQYHDLLVAGTVITDGAWSYPTLKDEAIARVGRDFSRYVAFDRRQITLED